jgi:hypothetical protein
MNAKEFLTELVYMIYDNHASLINFDCLYENYMLPKNFDGIFDEFNEIIDEEIKNKTPDELKMYYSDYDLLDIKNDFVSGVFYKTIYEAIFEALEAHRIGKYNSISSLINIDYLKDLSKRTQYSDIKKYCGISCERSAISLLLYKKIKNVNPDVEITHETFFVVLIRRDQEDLE